MRKIGVALLCMFLLLSAAACKNSEKTKQEDGYTFGYIAYNMTDIWNEYSARAFEYAASRAPVKTNTVILDSKNSLEESVTAIESLIQQGVDGISIFPISTEQGAQLVKIANEAGVPITVENFMMELPDPGDFIATIACEYDDVGYAAIKFIAENKPGAKIFFAAGQRGAGVYEKYQEGVDRAMSELGSRVSIVATLNGDWLTESAYNLTLDLINSGTAFDYVFANNGMMAKGCYQALKERGLDIPIVSTGGSPDDYQMLVDGIESANMTAPVSLQGVQSFKNLYDFVADGKSPAEKRKSLPIIPVSGDKLEEFIAWDDYAGAYNYVYNN
ncbi:MAG: sugar ABC transporter substrate-binding protein [Treponema sp.]|jgi:ABC-type sugar transport system substrate-binding protein|nr:sugar ABC transporter substrate-binding protein [Treponema sp.]